MINLTFRKVPIFNLFLMLGLMFLISCKNDNKNIPTVTPTPELETEAQVPTVTAP